MHNYYTYIEVSSEELLLVQQDLENLPEIDTSKKERLDTGQATEVIYFLVTARKERDDSIMSKAFLGEKALKDDFESEPFYGCVYYLTSSEVQEAYLALRNLSTGNFKAKVESSSLVAEVYPGVWSKGIDKAVDFLIAEYNRLLTFYCVVAQAGNAVIIAIE